MASIVTPKANPKHRWIQWTDADKSRKTLRLGIATNKIAIEHQRKVEGIIASRLAGLPIEPEVAKFIGGLSEELRKRYESCGLVAPTAERTKRTTLGDYLESYVQSRNIDAKLSSQVAFNHTRKRLEEYFTPNRDLATITASDAREFRKWLSETNKRDKKTDAKGLSLNTLKRRMGYCKQVFSQAVRDGLIPMDPFAGLPSSVKSNKERQAYVDLDTFAKVLEKAPNARWRALLVLARLGAFRIPSEAQG